MFSNKDLKNLIVPLFLEQLLMALVGIADVFVIGFVGEALHRSIRKDKYNVVHIGHCKYPECSGADRVFRFHAGATGWQFRHWYPEHFCGSDQPVYRKERREN